MEHPVIFWVGFHLLIGFLLALDLFVLHRKGRPVRFREACISTGVGVALALIFNGFVYFYFGPEQGLQFFTGYLIEKSLSVDNLFVFILIFSHLHIPQAYQHKILFWGILGALIFRISLILAGVALIQEFHWILYVLGAFLFISGLKLAFEKKKGKDPTKGLVYRMLHSMLPVAEGESGGRFFVWRKAGWLVTPLFLALLIIEFTDIVFALDSIPAIFAITLDPFIIYTSNIFAILGLRSLYFVLAPTLKKMHYFKWGLAAILVFVGLKMVATDLVAISVGASLLVIVAILGVTAAASSLLARKPSK